MSIFKKILPAMFLVAIISGCSLFQSDEPEIKRYSGPRFNMSDPIALNVNRIDIVSEFTPSFTRPNVEHLFPYSIEKTAKNWARDRLKAVDFSSDKIATVIIKDASVTEEMEPSEKVFTKDRVKYRATLTVVVRITDSKSLSRAETEVTARRELIIPADTDIAEKEKYWNGMVTKLFDEFNIKMEQNIYKYLNMYIADNTHIQTYE